jgi:hypothetical protein
MARISSDTTSITGVSRTKRWMLCNSAGVSNLPPALIYRRNISYPQWPVVQAAWRAGVIDTSKRAKEEARSGASGSSREPPVGTVTGRTACTQEIR